MIRIDHAKLEEMTAGILVGLGASDHEAHTVARHLVAANLAGHDSHGVIQLPSYAERVEVGHIVPQAPYEVVNETDTTLVVDGHWGFGYTVTERTMRRVIEKAKERHVAAATVYRQSHIGRLTDYGLMAAEEGLIAILTADSGRSPKSVAPFGGREARLGTNPLCIAVPSDLDGPLFIDMATSAVAAGKIMVALSRGDSIPDHWLVDAAGNPTTDPAALRAASGPGALLPLGGSEGHKGYGLSVIIEIFSGILTGLGFGVEPSGRHNDGSFLAAFDVSAFRPLDQFKRDVADLAAYLKSCPPAAGFDEVLYPGELEHRRTEQGRRDGIAIEEATWGKLTGLAEEHGVAIPAPR